MSKVTLSIKSEVSAEDVEAMLENFEPLIEMIISVPEIHITIEEED